MRFEHGNDDAGEPSRIPFWLEQLGAIVAVGVLRLAALVIGPIVRRHRQHA